MTAPTSLPLLVRVLRAPDAVLALDLAQMTRETFVFTRREQIR